MGQTNKSSVENFTSTKLQINKNLEALGLLLRASEQRSDRSQSDSILKNWLDASGSSVIRTLSKVWEDDAPELLGWLLMRLLARSHLFRAEIPAAAESAALGVAHLLPVLLRRELSHTCIPDSCSNFISSKLILSVLFGARKRPESRPHLSSPFRAIPALAFRV